MIEYRLYYDDNGQVLFYTCDKPEGQYLVIDAQTYAECRFDLKIVNGNIIKNNYYTITKLTRSNEGTTCVDDNIAIVVNDSYIGNISCWAVETYECR